MEPDHPWRRSLVEAEKAAEKAAEIANDLAAFSRQEKDTRAQPAGNLNMVLRRTAEVFQKPGAQGAGVNWNLELENRLYSVNFDEAKMQQALVKVLENSVQAIAQGFKGSINVYCRNLDLSESTHDQNANLAPGSYVCVEIKDDGIGISPEVLPRVFEPFFTTKHGHRGLGLAWVYGIITNHGGSVAISSEVGTGTSVRLYLPATKKIVRDTDHKKLDLRGEETILMVDDEDLLLTMGQMVLSSFGYKVLTANSGEKALSVFKHAEGHIDLLVTDVVMPQMSGRELAEHVRRVSPTTRIIYSSGYVRPASGEEDNYLQKPFTSQDLVRKVKHILTGV
jgi:CheY-like chemotaxis protein